MQILDDYSEKRLLGRDTECSVLIQNDDKPGNIGFPDTYLNVRRMDRTVYVKIHRTNGSDGQISCLLNTINDVELMPGTKPAVE